MTQITLLAGVTSLPVYQDVTLLLQTHPRNHALMHSYNRNRCVRCSSRARDGGLHYIMCQVPCSLFCALYNLVLTQALGRRRCYQHFVGIETETQRVI
jgi:hypothetical protein